MSATRLARHERLEAYHRALRLEAGALASDPSLLWQQLSNRLRWHDRLEDQLRAEEDRRLREGSPPWFRVLSPLAESPHLVGYVGAHGDVAFLDRSRLLTLEGDTLATWDGRTGMPLGAVVLEGGPGRAFTVNAAGTMAVVETPDGWRAHDLLTGTLLSRLADSGVPRETSGVDEAATMLDLGLRVGRTGASTALSPDGSLVAGQRSSGSVTVWYAASGEVRSASPEPVGALSACAFTPDGAAVLLGTREGSVLLWQPTAATQVALDQPVAIDPDRAVVLGCAVAPDGSFAVAVSGERITVWDLPSGRRRWSRQHFGTGRCCAVTPDAARLVTGGERGVLQVWDATSGDTTATFTGHTDTVTGCAVSGDGMLVASGAKDGTRLWDPAVTGGSEQFDAHDSRVTALTFSPDGELIASASADRRVLLWEAATRTRVRAFIGHDDAVQDCAFVGREGRLLVTVGHDGSARLWDVATAEERARLADSLDPWWGCAVSPDAGRALLCGMDAVAEVALPSGDSLATYHRAAQAWRCCYAADGSWAVVTLGDGTVTFLDSMSKTQDVAAHDRTAGVCAVSPDGAFAVTGGEDGTVRVWDPGTRQVRLVLQHGGAVWGCAVTADARYVVSTGWDHTLRVWDASDGHEVMRLTHPTGLHGCATDPTRMRIAYGDLTGRVYVVEPVGLEAGPVIAPPVVQEAPLDTGAEAVRAGIDRVLGAQTPRERILMHATKRCIGCGREFELLRTACPDCGSTAASPPGVEEMQFMQMRQGRAMELVNRGTLLFRAGKFSEAEETFREAVEVNPWNATACGNLSVVLARLGRAVEALEWAEKAVEIDPRVPGGQQMVEGLRRTVRRPEQAAPETSSDEVDAARRAMRAEDWTTAIQHFDRAIELDGRTRIAELPATSPVRRANDLMRAELHAARATAQAQRGDYRASLADLDRALELDPGEWLYREARGRAHYVLGQHREAVADWSEALEHLPSTGDQTAGVLLYRAAAHRQLDHPHEALEDLRRADVAVGNPAIKSGIDELRRTILSEEGLG